MASYLERYRSGDFTRVWRELIVVGTAGHDERSYDDALSVAVETMRRVRVNCDVIVDRLEAAGYEFGIYPDGSSGYHSKGPLIRPTADTHKSVAEIERKIGPIPLSLKAFWSEVGIVDLVGRIKGLPDMSDPLVVYGPEVAMYDWSERQDNIKDGYCNTEDEFEAGLSPDSLHKDNISGGAAYGVVLPDGAADFLWRNYRKPQFFVEYLRDAILNWGGFPGLEETASPVSILRHLASDLEPF